MKRLIIQMILSTLFLFLSLPLVLSQLDPLNPPEMIKPPIPTQENATASEPLQVSLQNQSRNSLEEIEKEAKFRVQDTDEDGWLDWEEMQKGTSPSNPDTDNDGLVDSVDLRPLIPDRITAANAPLLQQEKSQKSSGNLYIKTAEIIVGILILYLIIKFLQSFLFQRFHVKGIRFSFKRPTVIKIRKRIVKNLEIEE